MHILFGSFTFLHFRITERNRSPPETVFFITLLLQFTLAPRVEILITPDTSGRENNLTPRLRVRTFNGRLKTISLLRELVKV